jgi:hypothetical protein
VVDGPAVLAASRIDMPGDIDVPGAVGMPADIDVLGDIDMPGDIDALGDRGRETLAFVAEQAVNRISRPADRT